jgi:hypothetical protein
MANTNGREKADVGVGHEHGRNVNGSEEPTAFASRHPI